MMHYRTDFDGSDFLLKTYTDSDWACNKGTRKSVSACCLIMNNCLLNSGSRNQGLIALSSAEAETYAATSGACDALFLSRCLGYLLEAEISIKLLIDNSACRYILSRAGCGRVRHLSTRVLWMQQRVERKELSVGAVPSSENVADIGTKRLSVPTMKYLMHNLGVFDSETSTLVGRDEYEMKVTKQNLKLITTPSNFKVSANLIRLIVASSLAPADALSCGTVFSAMDMAWIDWSFLDGAAVNLLKLPVMQLYYLIEYMAVNLSKFPIMQLCYILEYTQAWMHGFAYLTGWLWFAELSLAQMPLTALLVECLCYLVSCSIAWHAISWSGMVKGRSKTGMASERSALPIRTNLASDMLNRWQFPGASTSDFFRALSTVSLMRYQLSLLVIAIFLTSVA